MKKFAQLLLDLENTSSTLKKVAALRAFFHEAEPTDRVWAIALFTHRRPKRKVTTRLLAEWAVEESGLDTWLFEESYAVVGDLAETLSLILPTNEQTTNESLTYWIDWLLSMEQDSELDKKRKILETWRVLDQQERFVFNKLITGGFRVGISKNLITRSLAEVTNQETTEMSHRLMGNWDPSKITYEELILKKDENEDLSKPYPFYLAYPLESEVDALGKESDWIAEWKWDGIRSQLIKREDQLYLWSRGEELITEKFPELHVLNDLLPEGTVIDGELLPFKDGQPLSFALLQTRIGRKNITKKQLIEAPARILAYDLLEFEGKDIRKEPIHKRRTHLADILSDEAVSEYVMLSDQVAFSSWHQLAELRKESRAHYAEGFMLKHKDSVYQTGRKRGDWWKWKVDPLSIDAVMIYAQKGHGRRADIYSDYTFAVWDGEGLVPFAKAYSGLTDKELLEVTRFVRGNTLERFGPVRTVNATQVFEIHFEGIAESKRHKSGIAVRFPRIHRWRRDKTPEEANTLDDLKSLLNLYG